MSEIEKLNPENCGHPYNKLVDGELVCVQCGAKPYGEKAAKKSADKSKKAEGDNPASLKARNEAE